MRQNLDGSRVRLGPLPRDEDRPCSQLAEFSAEIAFRGSAIAETAEVIDEVSGNRHWIDEHQRGGARHGTAPSERAGDAFLSCSDRGTAGRLDRNRSAGGW